MSTSQLAQFRQLVVDEWTDEQTVAAWRTWHPQVAIHHGALTDALLAAARVRPGLRVLDLASGTGHPALDLAAAVGPGGRVTATDLSAGMLAVAEGHAQRLGLANIAFRPADAHDLPFDDASFDLVTSRIGVMYFADVQRALGEIRRVLAPGGRVALVAWGPPERGTFPAALIGPFLRRATPAPPPPGMPQPLRFAQEGALQDELERAGFAAVEEEHQVIPAPWPGAPEEYWQFFYDIAVPFRPLFDGLPAPERAAAVAEVLDGLRAHDDGQAVRTTSAIVVASGVR